MAEQLTEAAPVKPEGRVYVSKAQQVGDMVAKQNFGPKGLDSNPDQLKESDETPKSEQDSDESVAETIEAKKVVNKLKPDKVDERKKEIQSEIDRMIAQKKQVEDELSQLNAKKEQLKQAPEQVKEVKEFTREELSKALETFVQDQDTSGVLDVIEYMLDQREKKYESLVEKMNKQDELTTKAVKMSEEWQDIVKTYSSYQDDVLKSDADFDIKNSEGKLFKLAKALYEDPEVGKRYRAMDNGQTAAVKEAYTELLKDKLRTFSTKKPIKTEVESLKNRLEKTQRKTSLVDGVESNDSGEGASEMLASERDKLLDAIKDRQSFKKSRMRGTGF